MIGHLLSVHDGERLGASQAELSAEENLATMCATCNLGLGRRSVSLLTYTIMRYLLQVCGRGSAARASGYGCLVGGVTTAGQGLVVRTRHAAVSGSLRLSASATSSKLTRLASRWSSMAGRISSPVPKG